MRVPGVRQLRQSARWLTSRLEGRALILGYHRVASPADDPFGLCVSPDRFAEQLEAIRRHADPVPLRGLPALLDAGRARRRAVVITFDDGYADILYAAKPLLDRHEIPATVFLASSCLGREFWWDALDRAVRALPAAPEYLELDLGGHGRLEWRPAPESRGTSGSAARPARPALWRSELRASLYHRLRPLPDRVRREAVDRLGAGSGSGPPRDRDATRPLTAEEVIRLARDGLVEIGGHTVTHPVLTGLPPAAWRAEVAGCKSDLEALLGRSVTTFSYPDGAASPELAACVADAGFALACTSRNDMARRRTDCHDLPRFWVADWDGDRFSRWLTRWLHGRARRA